MSYFYDNQYYDYEFYVVEHPLAIWLGARYVGYTLRIQPTATVYSDLSTASANALLLSLELAKPVKLDLFETGPEGHRVEQPMTAADLIRCYETAIEGLKISLLIAKNERRLAEMRALQASYEARILELRAEIAEGQD